MGEMAEFYRRERMSADEIRKENGRAVFDVLRANNRPEVYCIDAKCDPRDWCRLHLRSPSCPPFRKNGGYF